MTASSSTSCLVWRSVAEKSICAETVRVLDIHVRKFADHAVGFIDAGFRFRGARLGTAAQPFDLGVNAIFERVLMLLLRVEMRFFGFEKCAVVPFHAQDAVGVDAIEFDHIGGDIFEEIAIVADHDAGERRVQKQRFEPLDSGEIEMVGGLVEQQNVRLLNERLGNRETFAPAAGKSRGGGENRRNRSGRAFRRCARRSASGTPARSSAPSITERMVAPGGNSETCATELRRVPLRIATSPRSGNTRPDRISSSVDLPEPFGPIRPMRSPSDTVKEISWNRGWLP